MNSHRPTMVGLACLLLFGGCSVTEPTRTAALPMTTGSTSAASSTPVDASTPASLRPSAACPAAVPSSITVAKGTLPNGKSFGLVHHFDGVALYVDPAEFLGGKAAVTAAREDGEIGPGEDLPDPFYIRNPSKAIVRVPVSATLRVTVLASRGGSPTPQKLTVGELAALYCGGPRPDWLYSDPEELPVTITEAKGEVTQVDERYVP